MFIQRRVLLARKKSFMIENRTHVPRRQKARSSQEKRELTMRANDNPPMPLLSISQQFHSQEVRLRPSLLDGLFPFERLSTMAIEMRIPTCKVRSRCVACGSNPDSHRCTLLQNRIHGSHSKSGRKAVLSTVVVRTVNPHK